VQSLLFGTREKGIFIRVGEDVRIIGLLDNKRCLIKPPTQCTSMTEARSLLSIYQGETKSLSCRRLSDAQNGRASSLADD